MFYLVEGFAVNLQRNYWLCPAAEWHIDDMKNRRPICGTLSVAMPFFAILTIIAGETLTKQFLLSSHQEDLVFILAVAMFPVAGLATGIAGIVRHERKRWLSVIGVMLSLVFVFLQILDGIFPAGLDTKSTERAEALLFAGSRYSELPEKAEISIDGVKAVFQRRDTSYDQLVNLLHNGRTSEMLDKIGGGCSLHGARCGELVIRSYGITSRFPIVRAKDNENLYQIWIPHLNRGGRAGPIFTADPRVIELVKATGAKSQK